MKIAGAGGSFKHFIISLKTQHNKNDKPQKTQRDISHFVDFFTHKNIVALNQPIYAGYKNKKFN